MAVTKIEKADVWAGEVRDETGGLAAALAPLRAAGRAGFHVFNCPPPAGVARHGDRLSGRTAQGHAN